MGALKDLPFDQFSRQQLVADFISALKLDKEEMPTILDVGGYKGQTKRFCKAAKVTILDVFDVSEPNYIKGDGTNLLFKDKSFDFVVSFDVLEHIPKKERKDFITECTRVARKGFFLCCPFENGSGKATQAEKSLNSMYKTITGKQHLWLQEHIENGLPSESSIEQALNQPSLTYCKVYSNQLDNWITMQTLFFLSDGLNTVSLQAGKLNRLYNESLYAVESGLTVSDAYRAIYFISTDNQAVKTIQKSMDKFSNNNIPKQFGLIEHLPDSVGEIVQRKLKTQFDEMQHAINTLSSQLAQKEELMKKMRKSISWQVTKPLRAPKYLRGRK